MVNDKWPIATERSIMGKIRVKTIGDEEVEKKDLKKAQARAEAKKAREEAEARHAAESNVITKQKTKQRQTLLEKDRNS